MTREKKPTNERIAYEFVSPNGIPELHGQETGALVLYFAGGHLWSVIGSEQAEEIAIEVLKARGRWPE